MKEDNKTTRKRFYKAYHFLNKAGVHPMRPLYETFQNFHLDDFRREIYYWQEIALCNEQSAYDTGYARQDLMDFVKELQKLIEAMHLINEQHNRKKKRRLLKRLPRKTRQRLSGINNPILLTMKEQGRPDLIIQQFCKAFDHSYVHIELLDLLDAAITWEGNKEAYKGNMVFFYQHLHYLVKLSYNIEKNTNLVKS